jgi:prepilin-type processing-associated H-X9-DG protein
MTVAVPPGRGSAIVAFADGHRVPAKVARGRVSFTLSARVGSAADWAVERRR